MRPLEHRPLKLDFLFRVSWALVLNLFLKLARAAMCRYAKLCITTPMYRSQLGVDRTVQIILMQAQHGLWRDRSAYI